MKNLTYLLGIMLICVSSQPSVIVAKSINEDFRRNNRFTHARHAPRPDPISCGRSGEAFARGYCALARGRHGQWVRSKAELWSNGRLNVWVGLETDSGFFGIAGWTQVLVLDWEGTVIARYKMEKCAIPGKGPGKARIAEFHGDFQVAAGVVKDASNLRVEPIVADDNAPQPLGLGNYHVSVTVSKF